MLAEILNYVANFFIGSISIGFLVAIGLGILDLRERYTLKNPKLWVFGGLNCRDNNIGYFGIFSLLYLGCCLALGLISYFMFSQIDWMLIIIGAVCHAAVYIIIFASLLFSFAKHWRKR